MSYILDALKKSEIENNPEFAASLLGKELGAKQNRIRQRVIISLVTLVLLVNIGAVGWWFYNNNTASQISTIETASNTQVEQLAKPRTEPEKQVLPPEPASEIATGATKTEPMPVDPPTTKILPPEVESEKKSETGLRRLALRELPQAARKDFPLLDFSTHIYAEDSDLRAVVVNEQRLQEGELIGNLELFEITETGAVIRYKGYLVEVPVLDSWEDF